MKTSPTVKISAWAAALLIVVGIGALVIYLPIVAAVIFVLAVSFAAIGIATEKGKMKGILYFLKEILFGW